MSKQQYVMTSVNNLALLFDEALQQMQQQQANSKPGSGKCNKPGGSGSPGGKPQSMEQMKKQMEELDLPPVDEFMEMISMSGGKIYACKLAMDMFKLKKEDMVDYLDGVLTIGDFYARAAGDGTHIIFI